MQADQHFSHLFAAFLQHDKELVDPRGRTPLHLAVTLGYLDCVKCLLRGGCDANAINKEGWNGKLTAVFTFMFQPVMRYFAVVSSLF